MHIAGNMLQVIHCATDSHGVVIRFEGSGLQCLSLKPGDVVGKPIFDFCKNQAEAIAAIWRALAGEATAASLEAEGRVFEAHFTPVYDESRAVCGMAGVCIDVTEVRANRDALAEERQKRTNLESLAFHAGRTAHAFNNLLTGVLGNLSLAQMEADPGSTLAVSLNEAERACLRTRDLVAAMSTFSQEGGPVKTALPLEQCIRQAVLAAGLGAEVRCGIRIDPGLWSVAANEPQIRQVFADLLVNAGRAMPGGGIIEIDAWNTRAVEKLRPGRYVAIRVTDHGAEIPTIHLNRIFEANVTAREGGIGLATSHSIVANHGGELLAESHGGAGVSFTIYLPAAVAEAPKPKIEVVQRKENHARILVMDDEQSIRELTGRMLSSAGFQVDMADEGGDALRQYREAFAAGKPFDAVLLDLRVPCGMGGYETFQAIRGINPGVKAIISSGQAESSIMANYREHGIAAVVPKPYNINELLNAVYQTVRSAA